MNLNEIIRMARNKFINWCQIRITLEQRQFILAHEEDYNNLNNNSYWQRKMTPEEWEAKRHPNRSAGWIARRVENERDALRYA